MRVRPTALAVSGIVLSSLSFSVFAATLEQKTLAAWNRYEALTEARIASELTSENGFLVRDFLDGREQAAIRTASRRGNGVYVQPMRTRSEEGGDIAVPSGIVHHWYGTVLVPGAALEEVAAWVQDYDSHERYYEEVEASRLESRSGDNFDIFLRLRRKKVITVHYNTEHDVTYRDHGAGKASSRSESTRIAELEDPGTDREREKPVGDDRGFLWRLNSYWRFQQTEEGVVVECESISLSRSIPIGFSWVVRPFINSVPKESLESTLLPIRDAFTSTATASAAASAPASIVPASLTRQTAASSNWPQWRGPSRNGVSDEGELPIELGPQKNVVFKTAIPGRGHSSPILWGDRIFISTDVEGDVIPGASAPRHIRGGETYLHPASQSADKSHRLEVLCLDARTGEILWTRKAYEGRVFDNRHRENTYASPTGVTDGEHAYFYFGSQGLFAYDFDGELAWSVDFGDILTWGHGHGTSPLLHGEKLILQIDQDEGEGSFLVAVSKSTGEELWRTARRERINYSSPILIERASGHEIVTTSYENVIGYDADTGRMLWKSEGFLGNAVPTAVADETMVFAVSGYPDKVTRAIVLPGAGNAEAQLAWEYRKGSGYVPSPLLHGGYLYLVSDKGILTCIEPRTGEVVYEGGRVPLPTTVQASPVAWQDKILLAGAAGDLFVVRAGPKHEVLSVTSLDEPITASPAIASGRIYIRTEHHLYAFGEVGASTAGENRTGAGVYQVSP